MAHIKGWAAKGRLFSLSRLFGVAMQWVKQVPGIGADNPRGPKGCLSNTAWGGLISDPATSHLVSPPW